MLTPDLSAKPLNPPRSGPQPTPPRRLAGTTPKLQSRRPGVQPQPLQHHILTACSHRQLHTPHPYRARAAALLAVTGSVLYNGAQSHRQGSQIRRMGLASDLHLPASRTHTSVSTRPPRPTSHAPRRLALPRRDASSASTLARA